MDFKIKRDILQEVYDNDWDLDLVRDAILEEDLSKYIPIFRDYYERKLISNGYEDWHYLLNIFLEEGDDISCLIHNLNPRTNTRRVRNKVIDFCKEVVSTCMDS